MPSRELARRFLRVDSARERLLVSLLEPLLRPAGISYESGAGWSVTGKGLDAPTVSAGPGGARREPAARRSLSGEEPGTPSPASGSDGPPDQVACAVELARRRVRRVCLREVAAAPDGEGATPGGRASRRKLDGLDWGRISAFLRGTEAVFLNPRVEAPPLKLALASRGLPGPARIRGLASVARRAARFRRGATPEEMAWALGAAWLEGGDAATAAENLASCLAAVAGRAAQRGGRRGAGPPSFLTPGFLKTVPASPGVYRFLDTEGNLLYVGKASNLRRRLASYAVEASVAVGRRRRVVELLPGVARVEIRETGSDLQAVLEEASEIIGRKPRANVQRGVRERIRRYARGRCRALLLPAAGRGAVSVVFLRDGIFHGMCRIGPRGGGRRRALELLRSVMGAGSGPSLRRSPPAGAAWETQLVNSWLARNEEITQLDVDACRTPGDALERLMAAAKDLGREGGAGPVLHR